MQRPVGNSARSVPKPSPLAIEIVRELRERIDETVADSTAFLGEPSNEPDSDSLTDVVARQTRLRNRIEKFALRLSNAPWRCSVELEVDESNSIAFKRKNSVWRIVWIRVVSESARLRAVETGKPESKEPRESELSDCSASKLATIAEKLPALMDRMKAEFAERDAAINRGLKAMVRAEAKFFNEVGGTPSSSGKEGGK